MRSDIFFLIQMEKYEVYEGLDNVRKSILMQDNIDSRFRDNDLIDLVASVLLYHQLVDNMLTSLLVQNYYLEKLLSFPHEKKPYKIPNGFYDKIVKLSNPQIVFKKQEELILNAKKLNHIRNVVAHSMINADSESMIKELNNIKESYNIIQMIYQSTSVDRYNFIQSEIHNFDKYLLGDDYSWEDVKELIKYGHDNWQNIDNYIRPMAYEICDFLCQSKLSPQL